MNDDLVLVDIDDGLAVVTLNRPHALNALSSALRNRITDVFQQLRRNDDVGVIVLTGAGRAFTVGLDLKELGGERTPDQTNASADLGHAICEVDKPVIGAINGFAITGGFEIALMCDFLIASPNAKFADTHARVGVVPGWGLSQRLPRLIGINRAKQLSLTGNFLDAQTAATWGLVNSVVPVDELMPTCVQLARDILSTEPVTRKAIRHIMDEGWNSTLRDGLALELKANRAHEKAEAPAEHVAARRQGIQQRGRQQAK